MVTRRDVLTQLALAGGAVLVGPRTWVEAAQPAAASIRWRAADAILARIVAPVFPARDVPVTEFGAVGDGVRDCTAAFADAIATCQRAGGGRVVVPAGRFLTGPIRLRSGVNLHVSEGATIAFHTDPLRYLPLVFTRWEGVELMNYSPFVYAFEQSNIAITGRGTLDGQANDATWWPWKVSQRKSRDALMALPATTPVAERRFGEGHDLRPNFIQPYRCQNVLIEGVRVINSPMWEIHPVLSSNVTVRGVTVESHGPNNDGCNPESSRDVLIEHCLFDTGDDCIALKSGRNDDGRRLNVPVENVVIRDCVMKDGHGGVVIGSEISGGARNIFAERCRMDSPQLDRALRFKTNAVRGGVIEHISMRDVTVGQVAEAIVTVDFYYEEGKAGPHQPVVRDVEVRNVTSRKSEYALLLRGFPSSPVTDVRLIDCRLDGVAKPDVLESVRNIVLENVTINGQVRNETLTR